MKVNTDAVLLGAWQDVSKAENILDIGTGSGVIALMMAQQNKHAAIDAIDIDEGAVEQAKENFSNSPWNNRLTAGHCSLQNYFSARQYDLIITNPPYFIDDHKTNDHKKNIARHSIELDYETLVINIGRLLSDTGKVLAAVPVFNCTIFESFANEQKLYITRVADVTATGGKPPYLNLVQLEREMKIAARDFIHIQSNPGEFTDQYKALTRDFYLRF